METRMVMKKMEKIFAAFLVVTVLALSFSTQAAYANGVSPENPIGYASTDLYAQGATEVVKIDGVDYTYHYSYNDAGNRTIAIENNIGNDDVVVYDSMTSTIYLNNEVIGTIATANNTALRLTRSGDYVYVGTDSTRVTWAMGTSVSIVAGSIAIGVAGLGAGGVIAAIGSGSLSILAANSSGGTVTTDYYTANVGMQIFDKFVWRFTASTGDSYGPFTFVPPTAYSSEEFSNN